MSLLKCNQCLSLFRGDRIPKMMQYCDHNICDCCLDQIFKSNSQIQCGFCANIQNVIKSKKSDFLTNISVMNQVKEVQIVKEPTPSIFSLENQNLLIEEDYQQEPQYKLNPQTCKFHNKHLQIICVTDKIKICSHCALFGVHKGHCIITQKELQAKVIKIKKDFNQSVSQKKELTATYTEKTSKNQLRKKIQAQKDLQINKIYAHFQQMKKYIDNAQNNAYQQLAQQYEKLFNHALQKDQLFINMLAELNSMEIQIIGLLNSIDEINENQNLKKKLNYVFGNLEQMMNQSSVLLTKFRQQMHRIQHEIQLQCKNIHVSINSDPSKDKINKIVDIYSTKEKSQNSSIQKSRTQKYLRRKKSDYDLFSTLNNSRVSEKNEHNKTLNLKQCVTGKNINKSDRKSIGGLASMKSGQKISKTNLYKLKSPSKNIQDIFKNQCKGTLKKQHFRNDKKMHDFSLRQMHNGVLDLTGCQIQDYHILEIIQNTKDTIKTLKLSKNKLTNTGFISLLPYLHQVINLNLSENNLTHEILNYFIDNKSSLPKLRIINLTKNQISERLAKGAINELKNNGIITTI